MTAIVILNNDCTLLRVPASLVYDGVRYMGGATLRPQCYSLTTAYYSRATSTISNRVPSMAGVLVYSMRTS